MIYNVEQAISQAKTTEMYISGAFVDEFSTNNFVDANTHTMEYALVYANRRTLEYWEIFGDDLELTNDQLLSVISSINEYEDRLLLDVTDYTSQVGDSTLGSQTAPTVYGTLTPTPKSYIPTITEDGQTNFTMPFTESELFDDESLVLVLNGVIDPIIGTDYTFSGSTIVWISEIPLHTDDILEIKYWT